MTEIRSYIRRKLEMARDFPRESRLFANEILQGAPRIMPMLEGELKSAGRREGRGHQGLDARRQDRQHRSLAPDLLDLGDDPALCRLRRAGARRARPRPRRRRPLRGRGAVSRKAVHRRAGAAAGTEPQHARAATIVRLSTKASFDHADRTSPQRRPAVRPVRESGARDGGDVDGKADRDVQDAEGPGGLRPLLFFDACPAGQENTRRHEV